jgi:hypothetical protein
MKEYVWEAGCPPMIVGLIGLASGCADALTTGMIANTVRAVAATRADQSIRFTLRPSASGNEAVAALLGRRTNSHVTVYPYTNA